MKRVPDVAKLSLVRQTFFRLLNGATRNDEFVQKLPRYQFLINVLVLWDVLSHTLIFLLLLLLIFNLISFLLFHLM